MGEFDSNSRWRANQFATTTFDEFLKILREGGFSNEFVKNFKIVLWDVANGYYDGEDRVSKFETLADTPNFYHMSGLDPAGIAFLLGTEYTPTIPKTAEELFEVAMHQELLDKIK